jgi:hypothetical protein
MSVNNVYSIVHHYYISLQKQQIKRHTAEFYSLIKRIGLNKATCRLLSASTRVSELNESMWPIIVDETPHFDLLHLSRGGPVINKAEDETRYDSSISSLVLVVKHTNAQLQ